MNASIIICTRNRAQSLQQTLRSVAGLYIPDGWQCELIVVDNASSDSTQSVVSGHARVGMPHRLVSEERVGLSFARNAGLAAARGEIIFFTDDDVRLPEEWLDEMVQPILDGEAQAVAGGACCAPNLARTWLTSMHTAWLACAEPVGTLRSPRELIGVNMAFIRDVLSSVPAFDTELGAGALGFCEDTLFSRQLEAAGFRVAWAPHATVEHHFEESRLSRESFLCAAERRGCSAAYTDYHWEHKDPPALGLRLLRAHLRLDTWRRLNAAEIREREGIDEHEMELAYSVSYFKAFRDLLGTPRHYDQHGLVKKVGEAPLVTKRAA